MNLYETFNNKNLDFTEQGLSGNCFKTRIYFVSHQPAFTARLESIIIIMFIETLFQYIH